jgi:hypothetical protein
MALIQLSGIKAATAFFLRHRVFWRWHRAQELVLQPRMVASAYGRHVKLARSHSGARRTARIKTSFMDYRGLFANGSAFCEQFANLMACGKILSNFALFPDLK